MKRAVGELFRIVELFLREHLMRTRGASRHTVLAYRDALRLFFCHAADTTGRQVAELQLDDLTVERVLAFLHHLEKDRGNCAATRNLRLTALRGFFRTLVRHDPTRSAQYMRVLSLPSKKGRIPKIDYLEPEEVRALLRLPDRRTERGARNYALILFLYNTGARISETLALRFRDLQLLRPRTVRIHGKGRRDRVCPLWPETAAALRRIAPDGDCGDDPVFRSGRGAPLGRGGAARMLEKVAIALPGLAGRRVHPHILRHSCAVALLEAGVDLTVIRDYLGHQSIVTTGRYTQSNLSLKRRVLDSFWARAGLARTRDKRWHPTPDVLAFLESL